MVKNKLDKILLIVFFIFAALFQGCAKTVTIIPSAGTILSIEFSLRSEPTSSSKYFVIIATNEAYQLPSLTSYDELLEPGEAPQAGGQTEEYYYTNYYSTWASYIAIDKNFGSFSAKGPFIFGQTATKESVSTYSISGETISIQINLDKLFADASTISQFYIDIAAVDHPDASYKLLNDRLSSSNFIKVLTGEMIYGNDTEDSSIDSALDIKNWKVKIE